MSIQDTIQSILGDGPEDDETQRIDIDELDGDELQSAIDYLEAIGRDTKRSDIEEAAYYLRHVDDDTELFSAFESGEERGRIDRSLVAPNNMEPERKWHTRDGDFYQILTATSMPRLVTPGWLVPVTLSEHDVRLSMHIKPRETSSVKGRLQQRLTQMKSAIQWKKRRGRTDVYEEEHERKELERLLRNVIEGTTKLFNIGFYVEVHGNTHEELEEASRNIKRTVSEQGMDLTPVESRQLESQQSISPVGTDPIRNYNTVQLEALATFFNFVEPPVNQPEGILLGFDDSKRPVIVDRFDLSGHSKVVTGKIGGGKTYSVKMAIYRRLLNDSDLRTIIFDPLGDDFVDFTEKIGGTTIKFGGDDRINPLEIQPPTDNESATDLYTTKVRSFIEIMKTYFEQSARGGMTAGEEGVITQCTHYAYAKKGITSDPDTFSNESPIIDDVIEGVRIVAQGGLDSESSPVDEAMADGAGTLEACPPRTREIIEDPSDKHVEIAQNLVPKFESFKSGSVNNNLNGHTNIELDDRAVCFNMESFADTGEMPLIMHTMLDWAYQETRRSPRRTDVTFEEAHYLLNRSGARQLLNLFIRHARHFDAGLTLISQTPDEFLGNDEKKEIYDNCDIKQLFYQENVSAEVIDYFDFSQEEVRFLRQAARGQNSNFSECLLSTSEHGRRRLEIYAGPFERHMLEEDLDPWGYLEQQGLADEDATVGGDHLSEAMPEDGSYADHEHPASQHHAVDGDKRGPKIDSPDELTNHDESVPHDPEDVDAAVEDDSVEDPFRVKGNQTEQPARTDADAVDEPETGTASEPGTDEAESLDDTQDHKESTGEHEEEDAGLGELFGGGNSAPRGESTETVSQRAHEPEPKPEPVPEEGESSTGSNQSSGRLSFLTNLLPGRGSRSDQTKSETDDQQQARQRQQRGRDSDTVQKDDAASVIDFDDPRVQWALKVLPIAIVLLSIFTIMLFQPDLITGLLP